jgi:GTP-binding protein
VRCKVLVFVLDMAGSEGREPLEDYASLRRELDFYDPTLAKRPAIIVANKMDLDGAATRLKQFKTRRRKSKIVPASAVTGEGLEHVRDILAKLIFDNDA